VEIRRRIEALQREMDVLGANAVFIAHRIDLLYFSGCAQNAYLYVPREGEPVLLVRRYAPRAARDSPIAHQVSLASIRDIPERLAGLDLDISGVLGTAWDALPVREFGLFRRLFPSRAHVDVSGAIHRVRALKSAWEVERVAESARVCEETLDHLRDRARPGMSEAHLAGLSEAFSRRLGHGGGIRVRQPSEDNRSGWIDEGDDAIPAGRPFTCGFRAVVNGYHAAGCRIFQEETGSRGDRRLVRALRDAHARILSRSGSGTSPADVERAARSEGCGWNIHGIGLELREPLEAASPVSSRDLNVCLVLETITNASAGRTFRLQDTLVVGEGGVRSLRSPVDPETGGGEGHPPPPRPPPPPPRGEGTCKGMRLDTGVDRSQGEKNGDKP
jgi:Xaa-Pro aminopeptidase